MLYKLFRPVKMGLFLGLFVGIVVLYVMFHDEEERMDPLLGAQLYESVPKEDAVVAGGDPILLAGSRHVVPFMPVEPALIEDEQ